MGDNQDCKAVELEFTPPALRTSRRVTAVFTARRCSLRNISLRRRPIRHVPQAGLASVARAQGHMRSPGQRAAAHRASEG